MILPVIGILSPILISSLLNRIILKNKNIK
jgi:hypothetical protein